MMLRLTVVALASAKALGHAFKDCPADFPHGGSTGNVPFTSITLTPDPPEADQLLKVEFTTDPVKTAITGGHGLFTVKFHGIQILQKSIDICGEMGLNCPIPSGSAAKGSIEYQLPPAKFRPTDYLDCFFQVVDEHGKYLDCVNFVVHEAKTTTNKTTFITEEMARDLYAHWKIQYSEQVTISQAQDNDAVKQFTLNLRTVDAHNRRHNQGLETYTMSMNAFSHLSWKEFRSIYIGGYGISTHTSASKGGNNIHYANATSHQPPKSIDWTTKGAVTAVKNQGQCGSCWAFSTTGSLEGAYYLKSGNLRSLSEQQLVDCDRKKDQGCNGGLMDNAFDFVSANGGLCQETDYPYTGVDGSCQTTCKDVLGTTVTTHTDVDSTEAALMSAIAQQPVSIAIEADQRGFQFYSSGVFSGSCGTTLDHGVLAVGYGIVDNQPYWKVKNSWGER